MTENEMMYLVLHGINLFVLIMVAAFLAITPMLTRKSLLFGVRVPEAVNTLPEVRALKRRFITVVSACALLLCGGLTVQYFLAPELSLLACLYAPLLMVGAQLIAFIPCWKRASALKRERGWHAANPATAETRTAAERSRFFSFPRAPFLLSLIIPLVCAVWSLAVYPDLPDPFPTHWNFNMQPDAWAPKSIWSVLAMPLVMTGMILILALSAGSMYKIKLQVSPEDPQKSYAQHKLYRRMQSNALGFMTVCLTLFTGTIQLMSIGVLSISGQMMVVLSVVLIGASLLPIFYVYFKAGQSGCKLEPRPEDYPAAPSGAVLRPVPFDRSDDRFWKLGMFYYNPDDPAIFVEDRFGTNGGFNYARKGAIWATAGLIAMTAGVCAVLTFLYVSGAF